MTDTTKSEGDWADELLEKLVHESYGTIWYDYKERIKNDALSEAAAEIRRKLAAVEREARIDELERLLNYWQNNGDVDYANNRLKELTKPDSEAED